MTKRSHDYKNGWENYEAGFNNNGPNTFKRLRRNKIDGVFGGVCSGIGDYFGLDHTIVRVLFVLSVIFLQLPLLVYILLWIFIPKDVRAPYQREYRQTRRAYRESPSAPVRTTTFKDVRSKFRSLEERMQDLEKSITSKEWKLRRDFRDLES